MRRFFRFSILLLVITSPFLCKGQNVADKIVKEYRPNAWRLTLRYDHYLKTGSFFFFENNNRFNQQPTLGNSFPFNIHRTYLMAGYEQKAAEKWYLGISEKYVVEANFKMPHHKYLYTRLNVSHRGNLLKMKFIKEVALEHIHNLKKSDNPNIIIENRGRLSLSPSLVKQFKVNGRALYLILNYRAYLLFDFNNDGMSSYDKRKIDKTRLRVEVDYRISDKILFSLFAIRDTDYSYRLSQFDQFNNMTVEEARVNRITPTFGMSINFTMNAPEDFLPGFPIK